jgi:protein-disulfide isomerase
VAGSFAVTAAAGVGIGLGLNNSPVPSLPETSNNEPVVAQPPTGSAPEQQNPTQTVTADGIAFNSAGMAIARDHSAPVTIEVYSDFQCPHCSNFKNINGDDLLALADLGVSVVFQPVAFLDQDGYSAITAIMIQYVAANYPELFWDLNTAMISGDVKQSTSIDDFLTRMQAAGLPFEGSFAELAATDAWNTASAAASQTTQAAQAAGVQGVPAVFINGEQWRQSWSEPGTLRAFVENLLG